MNKFGFAAVVASGLTAAILGLAAPAQGATAVNAPTVVASAINIPTDFDTMMTTSADPMPIRRTS